VNIVDGFPDVLGRPEVAVVASAALPESEFRFPVRLGIRHTGLEFRGLAFHKQNRPLRDRLLQCAEDATDAIDVRARIDQQVDVLGHDHVLP